MLQSLFCWLPPRAGWRTPGGPGPSRCDDALRHALDARSHQARGERLVFLAEFLAPGPAAALAEIPLADGGRPDAREIIVADAVKFEDLLEHAQRIVTEHGERDDLDAQAVLRSLGGIEPGLDPIDRRRQERPHLEGELPLVRPLEIVGRQMLHERIEMQEIRRQRA